MKDRLKPIEILLVEDNASDARLIQRWLLESAWVKCVHVINDGEAALEALRANDRSEALRPHLMLLDLNLPRMDGFEVLAEMKADSELADIPVVMLTASSFADDEQRARALKANLYLPKPADADEFTALVDALELFWRARV